MSGLTSAATFGFDIAAFQSARGLAHSKTLRVLHLAGIRVSPRPGPFNPATQTQLDVCCFHPALWILIHQFAGFGHRDAFAGSGD
jgi:hypothetical protein